MKKYSEEQLQQALQVLHKESRTLNSVAKEYGIPERTLCCHWKNPNLKTKHGPSVLLSSKKEKSLVKYVESLQTIGLKVRSQDVLKKAEEIYKVK